MNLNNCTFAGRLTKTAELGSTRGGTSKSKFRMAINDRRNDKTLFLNVLSFGKLAENLNEYLVQGRLVSVVGTLTVDDYKDENEVQRTSVCLMANDIQLGPEKAEKTSDSD